MSSIWLAAVLYALLAWSTGGVPRSSPGASPAADSRGLHCRLQCSDFECDIPPSVNLSLPLKVNSTMSCPVSSQPTVSHCHVRKTANASKLVINFLGFHLKTLYNLIITSGNQVIFDNKPCIYEKPHVSVHVSESSVEVISLSCHFEEQVQSRVICRPERGALINQTFLFKNATVHPMTGFRPFTRYNCSIHNRYEQYHPRLSAKCTSRWSNGGFHTFRTEPTPPSAAPTPLGFLRRHSECHVYFEAVPPARLNGRLQHYKWKCGELSGKVSKELFTFQVDCAALPITCFLWATNQKGDGPKSQPLLLRRIEQRPRLQLWSAGAGAVRPLVEGGSKLLICGCKSCAGDPPKCDSLTTKPLANLRPFRVNLNSTRVALLRNDGMGLVMSDWVSCKYDPGAAPRTSRPLNVLVKNPKRLLGNRLQIKINNSELRCPRATRPIDVLKARRICGSGETSDFDFPRSSEKFSKFTVHLPDGCDLWLSADNETFFPISSRQRSSGLSPGAIAGMIIAILFLFALVFLFMRYRQAFFTGYRNLCHEPTIQNGTSNGYGVALYPNNDHDGYVSVDDLSSYHFAEKDEGTRPVRDEDDYQENYTVRS